MSSPSGNIVATFTQSKTKARRLFFVWVGVSVLLIILMAATLLTPGVGPGSIYPVLIVLLLLGAFVVAWGINAFSTPRKLEVYPDGFVLVNTKDNSVINSALWSEVSDITWKEEQGKNA